MLKNLLVLLIVCALGYFFFIRDRYVNYPISITVSDQQDRTVDARIIWRDATRIQFEKPSDSKSYFYDIDKLDMLSRAKILFLPISQVRAKNISGENGGKIQSNLNSVHLEGLRKELRTTNTKLENLKRLRQTSTSETEKNTFKRDIDLLERKLVEIEIRIQKALTRSQ